MTVLRRHRFVAPQPAIKVPLRRWMPKCIVLKKVGAAVARAASTSWRSGWKKVPAAEECREAQVPRWHGTNETVGGAISMSQ